MSFIQRLIPTFKHPIMKKNFVLYLSVKEYTFEDLKLLEEYIKNISKSNFKKDDYISLTISKDFGDNVATPSTATIEMKNITHISEFFEKEKENEKE